MTANNMNVDTTETANVRPQQRSSKFDDCCDTTSVTTSSSDFDKQHQEHQTNSSKVSFRNIEVFEHSIIMGDNPSVSAGAPLTISWHQESSEEFDIDEYEFGKLDQRKEKNELRLSVSERANMLLQSGYTIEDIVRRSIQVNEDKNARAESIRNQKWDGLKYGIGRTTSKLKKVVRRSSMLATTPFRGGSMNNNSNKKSSTNTANTVDAKNMHAAPSPLTSPTTPPKRQLLRSASSTSLRISSNTSSLNRVPKKISSFEA